MDDEARRAFAVPPASGEFDGIDLALLDPSDPDERRMLIIAEHPELAPALVAGRREIHVRASRSALGSTSACTRSSPTSSGTTMSYWMVVCADRGGYRSPCASVTGRWGLGGP
jgi:hypothetical protein